jgi:putative transcriptional regulator
MEDEMVRFRLHVAMAERNILTIKEMVELTGLERNTVSFIYNNKAKMINLKTLDTLCKALKCTPGDLFEYLPDNPA